MLIARLRYRWKSGSLTVIRFGSCVAHTRQTERWHSALCVSNKEKDEQKKCKQKKKISPFGEFNEKPGRKPGSPKCLVNNASVHL